MLGGAATNIIGLGRALWIFGTLQIVSNLGYVLLANIPMNRFAMYSALGFETLTQGLGTGAFSVLLLRMTQKRFSAAQYALFSTLFGMGRILSGPVAGVTVDSLGWSLFFWISIPLGLPGLFMLSRFVRWSEREPRFEIIEVPLGDPLSRRQLLLRGSLGGLGAFLFGATVIAVLGAFKQLRADPEVGLNAGQLLAAVIPQGLAGWLQFISLVAFAVVLGLLTAAVAAARRGAGRDLATDN